MWRSPVAHLLWEQGVAGSNPATPTIFTTLAAGPLCGFCAGSLARGLDGGKTQCGNRSRFTANRGGDNMPAQPMETLLRQALQDFRAALVARNVYDADHPNLARACNGAKDFVAFLISGPTGLRPRPPRR